VTDRGRAMCMAVRLADLKCRDLSLLDTPRPAAWFALAWTAGEIYIDRPPDSRVPSWTCPAAASPNAIAPSA
jgi:hypothetical protein